MHAAVHFEREQHGNRCQLLDLRQPKGIVGNSVQIRENIIPEGSIKKIWLAERHCF